MKTTIKVMIKRSNSVCIKKKKKEIGYAVVYVCKMHSQFLSFTKRNITGNGLEVKNYVLTNILESGVWVNWIVKILKYVATFLDMDNHGRFKEGTAFIGNVNHARMKVLKVLSEDIGVQS